MFAFSHRAPGAARCRLLLDNWHGKNRANMTVILIVRVSAARIDERSPPRPCAAASRRIFLRLWRPETLPQRRRPWVHGLRWRARPPGNASTRFFFVVALFPAKQPPLAPRRHRTEGATRSAPGSSWYPPRGKSAEAPDRRSEDGPPPRERAPLPAGVEATRGFAGGASLPLVNTPI